jgi:hypothetical protein
VYVPRKRGGTELMQYGVETTKLIECADSNAATQQKLNTLTHTTGSLKRELQTGRRQIKGFTEKKMVKQFAHNLRRKTGR